MNQYWAIKSTEGGLDVYLPSDEAKAADGISPDSVRRNFLNVFRDRPVFLQFANGDRIIEFDEKVSQPADMLTWNWVRIFSRRAHEMMVQIGVGTGDFVACVFDHQDVGEYFMYLPLKTCDVVDVDASSFSMFIPLKPPLPFGIKRLVFKGLKDSLPNCFLALVPGHQQVFNDVIVSDLFCAEWASRGLTGARFQRLT